MAYLLFHMLSLLKKLVTSLPRVVFNCTCLLELSEEFRKLNLVSTQWCAAIFNYWLSGVVMGGSGRFGSQHGPAPAPTTSSSSHLTPPEVNQNLGGSSQANLSHVEHL